MEIKGKYLIAGPREDVWAALNDPAVLEACIPGCESFTRKGDSEFDADVVAKVGPVRAKFKTTVKLENVQPPLSYTLVGSSKGGAAGFARGQADVSLESTDEGTELSYTAEFKVGGKLAQIGSRLVVGATKKTADEFFGSLSTKLDPAAQKIDDEESAGSRPIVWAIGGGVIIALLLWWWL